MINPLKYTYFSISYVLFQYRNTTTNEGRSSWPTDPLSISSFWKVTYDKVWKSKILNIYIMKIFLYVNFYNFIMFRKYKHHMYTNIFVYVYSPRPYYVWFVVSPQHGILPLHSSIYIHTPPVNGKWNITNLKFYSKVSMFLVRVYLPEQDIPTLLTRSSHLREKKS